MKPSDLLEQNKEFVAASVEPYRVCSSSGTTEHPKTLYKTVLDSSSSTEIMCRLFRMAGLERGDRLLIGQPFDLAHLGYLCLDACRMMGILAIPIGLAVDDARFIRFLTEHRPTAVFSSPSRMCAVARRLEREGAAGRFGIRQLLLAGEKLTDSQRILLAEFWGTRPHELYGSEETDGLAGSCEHHAGLHFMDDRFVLELLDQHSDEPVKEGETGTAVITSLYAKGTPLIRYRLGDRIRKISDRCECGRPWPLLTVQGRSDDALFLYDGIKLKAEQVESSLRSLRPDLESLQLICSRAQIGVDEVKVVLASRDDTSTGPSIRQMEDAIWDSSLDLQCARQIGSIRFTVLIGRQHLHVTTRGKTPTTVDLRRHESVAAMEA